LDHLILFQNTLNHKNVEKLLKKFEKLLKKDKKKLLKNAILPKVWVRVRSATT